jgi:hypothetical protein
MEDSDSAWMKDQMQFLDLLNQLTKAGRADWLRSASDPVFVYCLIDGDDLIKFECKGGAKGDEPVPPTEDLAGVVSHYCNTTYLWLTGLANWELLLQLLRSAKIDERRFIQCRRIAHGAPVRVLESRLKI